MNALQRQEFLDQSRAHYAADMLLKGTFGTEKTGTFRGCSVGCHLHHINPEHRASGKHAAVANYYGYPEWLARLQDSIFEGLPDDECNRWHLQLAETLYTLPDDYDWQAAMHRVLVAILRVALQHAGKAAPVVQTVIDLHERAARGETVTDKEWQKAERAAALTAERAARVAAWATAWAAARAAGWAAGWTAARAAGWAAARAAAWAASRAAGWAARAALAERAARTAWAAHAAAEAASYQQIRDGVLAALAQTGEKS